MKNPILQVFLILFPAFLFSQPPVCSPASMALTCQDACVSCDIDGFFWTNQQNGVGSAPPGYCTFVLHNAQWIGFVAGSVNLSIEITVSNCSGNGGMEMGIYSGVDCQNFTLISNCNTAIFNNTSAVITTTTPLVIGQYYWIVIDSNGGGIMCDMSFRVTNGSTQAPPLPNANPIVGRLDVCENDNETYSTTAVSGATDYEWFLDGNSIGTGLSANVQFGPPGTYDICVEASSLCSISPQTCETVEVHENPILVRQDTICPGECVTVGGVPYCSPGTHNITLLGAAPFGCDSLITLTLIQGIEDNITLNPDICDGETYSAGGINYDQTGNYVIDLKNQYDCDSTINLNLTVNPHTSAFLTEIICFDETFTVGNDVFDQTGVYTDILLVNSKGCDSIVDLDLEVLTFPQSSLVETICENETVTVGTAVFNQPGTYDVILQNTAGCDSLVMLDLSTIPTFFTPLYEEICEGDTAFVGNNYFMNPGGHDVLYTAANGCDSIVNLDLFVFALEEITIESTLCEGDTLYAGDEFFTKTGKYTTRYNSTDSYECDTLVFIDLEIITKADYNLKEQLCFGDSIIVGGQTFEQSGNYDILLQSAAGCDSTVHLDLIVFPELKNNLTETICEGESITVGGQNFDSTGIYNLNLSASGGCDSTVHLNLTVFPKKETPLPVQLCEGDSVQVGNQTFDETGNYDIQLQTNAGCDSTVHLNLMVVQRLEIDLTESICIGETIRVGNEVFDSTGNYQIMMTSQSGCDSLINLELKVNPEATTPLRENLCSGDSIQVGNRFFDKTGEYDILLSTTAGCDSLVRLDLEIQPPIESFLTEEICFGSYYTVDDLSFTLAGRHEIVLASANGCDSTVYLDLTVLPEIETDLPIQLCEGETYQIENQTFDETGLYEVVLQSSAGCDSMVHLDLEVLQFLETNLVEEICEGEHYEVGTEVFDQAGQFQVLFQAGSGCDSIVNLNLKVNPKKSTPINRTLCFGETTTVGNQVFDETGQFYVLSATDKGCDSLIELNLRILPEIKTYLPAEICFGTSYFVGNQEFSQPGIYEVILASANGCDSLVDLNLSVLPKKETDLPRQICENQTVTIGGQTFTETGQYEIILPTVGGCDSTVYLDLEVLPFLETQLTESICAGESYPVGAESFENPGHYQIDLATSSGCDSIVRLDLSVIPLPELNLNESRCFGDSVTVGGIVFRESGDYNFQILAQSGCDTIVNLNLFIEPEIITDLPIEICDNQSYFVDNQEFVQPGQFEVILPAVGGCDSTVQLDLTVHSTYDISLNEEICPGESFKVGNESFGQSGQYQVILSSQNQCDSIVNLTLAVEPCEVRTVAFAEKTKCHGSNDGSIELTVKSGTPPFRIEWNRPGFNSPSGSQVIADRSEMPVIEGLPAGDYEIRITDQNDLEFIMSINVAEPEALSGELEGSSFAGYQIRCFGFENGFAEIKSTRGGTPPYRYSWSTGDTTARIENLTAGLYHIRITDANNCEIILPKALRQPDAILLSAIGVPPDCQNETGYIEIENLIGGVAPFMISINGNEFNTVQNWEGLPPGNYQVMVRDTFGCEKDTLIIFEDIIPIELELGETVNIELGDSLQLSPVLNRIPNRYFWEGANLSCDDCSEPYARPMYSTNYRLTVFTDDGCIETDQILVRVDRGKNIFVPSGFSPDGDGNNDFFMIYAGKKVSKIKSFQVFSRWGERVFEQYNFQPNEERFGWNGAYKNRELNSAVFVWYAEVEFIDGETEVFKGDVTLKK